MPKPVMRYALLAAAVVPLATMAGAASTRSSNALPNNHAQAAEPEDKGPQGPKNGFPDNRGLERAREVANEHARFLRHDSDG